MKFSCNKTLLVEAVTNIQRAVSTKSSIPALEGIFLRAKSSGIELCGYDLELGMTTTLEGQIEEPGSLVLGAKLFADIVRRLPGDTVEISADSKLVTSIVSGPAQFSIAGIPSEEYPDLPSVHSDQSIELPQALLKSMIRQTIFAVAETDAKPIHTGTLFELSDHVLKLVSVDGYRLAIRQESVSCDFHTSFVVPGKTLSELVRLLKDEESPLSIQISGRHILFSIDRYTIISRLLEGEFLDYRSAVPAAHTTEILVKTRTFLDSVERVSLLITDRLKSPVRCIFEEPSVKISCSTPIGRANDQFEASVSGNPVEMGFNNRYLLDALRFSESDEVRILLNSPIQPMVLLPKQGEDFLFLVLPVRLKAEGG